MKPYSFPLTKRSGVLLFFACVLLICLALPSALCASTADDEKAAQTDAILASADGVFNAMKAKDYPAIWRGLTLKSQKGIVKSVRKALDKTGIVNTDESVRDDFARGGELAQGYWGGYLVQFDPRSALDECTWNMGEIKKDKAEIILLHKKSENPAILKMYREAGAWKVGLDETFATRQMPFENSRFFHSPAKN